MQGNVTTVARETELARALLNVVALLLPLTAILVQATLGSALEEHGIDREEIGTGIALTVLVLTFAGVAGVWVIWKAGLPSVLLAGYGALAIGFISIAIIAFTIADAYMEDEEAKTTDDSWPGIRPKDLRESASETSTDGDDESSTTESDPDNESE